MGAASHSAPHGHANGTPARIPSAPPDLLAVPAHRLSAIRRLLAVLTPGRRVALSTHINADGDGCGSEAGFARILAPAGIDAASSIRRPWPGLFDFLLGRDVDDQSARGAECTGRRRRPGRARHRRRASSRHADGHGARAGDPQARDRPPRRPVTSRRVPSMLSDTTACATGELVFDLAVVGRVADVARRGHGALYGAAHRYGRLSFQQHVPAVPRHCRLSPVAGDRPRGDVSPRLCARSRSGACISCAMRWPRWMSIRSTPSRGSPCRRAPSSGTGCKSEDLDGIAEHPRSIAGTRLAMFFRDLGHGKVKVSFRSTGACGREPARAAVRRRWPRESSGRLVAGSLEAVRGRRRDGHRRAAIARG